MATATQTVEQEILDATEESDQRKGEDRNAYIYRVVKAAGAMPEKDFNKLSQGAQDFYNQYVEARNSKKPTPDFPDVEDAEEDDETDDDDAPPRKSGKAQAADPDEDEEESDSEDEDDSDDDAEEDDDEETEEEDEPVTAKSAKRTALADDEEEEKPAKRGPGRPKGSTNKPKAQEAEEDDDPPVKRKPGRPPGSKSKPKAEAEDEDGDEPKKPGAQARITALVVKNPLRDREKLYKLLTEKEGYEIKQTSVNVMYYGVLNVIKELANQGALAKDYAEKLAEQE